MLLKIYPENPDPRQIQKIVKIIQNGGIIIYPTDTVYGIGCDITQPKVVEKLAKLTGQKNKSHKMSFICYDLSNLSEYARVETNVYKIMRKNLPGAFTFILNANKKVPKTFMSKKKTVGIRIPDNNIAREIVKELGNPIVSISVRYKNDDLIEYPTDPELIHDEFKDIVDVVIDAGFGNNEASTVIDCTQSNDIEILREGLGVLEY